MIYVCTCPQCGLVVRSENPTETACTCLVPYEVVVEDVGTEEL
jgi:hypothetical protein